MTSSPVPARTGADSEPALPRLRGFFFGGDLGTAGAGAGFRSAGGVGGFGGGGGGGGSLRRSVTSGEMYGFQALTPTKDRPPSTARTSRALNWVVRFCCKRRDCSARSAPSRTPLVLCVRDERVRSVFEISCVDERIDGIEPVGRGSAGAGAAASTTTDGSSSPGMKIPRSSLARSRLEWRAAIIVRSRSEAMAAVVW